MKRILFCIFIVCFTINCFAQTTLPKFNCTSIIEYNQVSYYTDSLSHIYDGKYVIKDSTKVNKKFGTYYTVSDKRFNVNDIYHYDGKNMFIIGYGIDSCKCNYKFSGLSKKLRNFLKNFNLPKLSDEELQKAIEEKNNICELKVKELNTEFFERHYKNTDRYKDSIKHVQDSIKYVNDSINVNKIKEKYPYGYAFIYDFDQNSIKGLKPKIMYVCANTQIKVKYILFDIETYNKVDDIIDVAFPFNNSLYKFAVGEDIPKLRINNKIKITAYHATGECIYYNGWAKTVKITYCKVQTYDGEWHDIPVNINPLNITLRDFFYALKERMN